MRKPPKPLKPFRDATWNARLNRWEGWIKAKNHKWVHKKEPAVLPTFIGPKKKKHETAVQKRRKIYEKLKKEWRKNPTNQYCRAYCKKEDLIKHAEPNPHHMKGRTGILLLDVLNWLPVCFNCHRKIHDVPSAAYKNGFLVKSGSKT